MTRDDVIARLAAMDDDDLCDTLFLLADTPDAPDGLEKRRLIAAEITRRPLGRYLVPGERADHPADVAWAVARRHLWGDLVEAGR